MSTTNPGMTLSRLASGRMAARVLLLLGPVNRESGERAPDLPHTRRRLFYRCATKEVNTASTSRAADRASIQAFPVGMCNKLHFVLFHARVGHFSPFCIRGVWPLLYL